MIISVDPNHFAHKNYTKLLAQGMEIVSITLDGEPAHGVVMADEEKGIVEIWNFSDKRPKAYRGKVKINTRKVWDEGSTVKLM